jgi:2-methylaconitate cis-trans-isomerase PrpF
MTGTGAVYTAACSRVPGTIVNRVTGKAADQHTVDIVHPIGAMSVSVQKEGNQEPDDLPVFRTLSFVRTACRIMDGTVYVPGDFAPTPSPEITH